ncbi:hypothetical protein BU17DRAFT_98793 [Hysterangium stoloniferum]|nr:hypothetical protein BU17DRAFT_98793 [Hysterangium stoloniferum]
MSYSAFFTAGLALASQPRTELDPTPPIQINILPGTPAPPRPRLRKRRSSLTIATSPISTIKSPMRNTAEAIRISLRSPSHGTFTEALNNGTRPKFARRKTVSHTPELPTFPAPTSPLPPLPNILLNVPAPIVPSTPLEEIIPSSPVVAESIAPPLGTLRSNPARKSSLTLPVGRSPFSSIHAVNVPQNNDMEMLLEEKNRPINEWIEDAIMKENERD